jgi:ribose 5-phosphate isomerase B
MKLAIGSDHGGLNLKNSLVEFLKAGGHEVSDEGTFDCESCDYPVFAKRVANKVASGECDFGVLVCTSGVGMAITANKVKNVRAVNAHNEYEAEMSRRHNNCNVICFGEKQVSFDLAAKCVEIFLSIPFEGGRHTRRVEMFEDNE